MHVIKVYVIKVYVCSLTVFCLDCSTMLTNAHRDIQREQLNSFGNQPPASYSQSPLPNYNFFVWIFI